MQPFTTLFDFQLARIACVREVWPVATEATANTRISTLSPTRIRSPITATSTRHDFW